MSRVSFNKLPGIEHTAFSKHVVNTTGDGDKQDGDSTLPNGAEDSQLNKTHASCSYVWNFVAVFTAQAGQWVL